MSGSVVGVVRAVSEVKDGVDAKCQMQTIHRMFVSISPEHTHPCRIQHVAFQQFTPSPHTTPSHTHDTLAKYTTHDTVKACTLMTLMHVVKYAITWYAFM